MAARIRKVQVELSEVNGETVIAIRLIADNGQVACETETVLTSPIITVEIEDDETSGNPQTFAN